MRLHVGLAATVATAVMAIGVSLAGCSGGHSAPGAKPTRSAPQSPPADDLASEVSKEAQTWFCCPPRERDPDVVVPRRDPMVELWTAAAPRGTAPQISLRFLRALQSGDELAAATELSAWGR